ncbi:MAG TPA: hypothetical protein VE377_25640 [Candidatus Dormibacteraeota bacterium]|nr:hypothetical protein [Candidatus Dormibacteraeota bacterium]
MSLQVQWLTASPLWGQLSVTADKGPFRSPALLRFATDQFMQDLQGVLASKTPGDIAQYVAQPEAWWSPAAGLASSGTTNVRKPPAGATDPPPFKLFQPVQSRFYIASASLVCRLPGLPDHTVKGNLGESTAFVLRKLTAKDGLTNVDLSVFDSTKMDENAWIPGDRAGWAPAIASTTATGEEKLPMFALPFGTNGSTRRIHAGVIPASRRQTYVSGQKLTAAAKNKPPSPATSDDPRAIEFQSKVLDPWVELSDLRDKSIFDPFAVPPAVPLAPGTVAQMTAGVEQASALILIDFATFLKQELPNVWNVVNSTSQNSTLNNLPAQLALYQTLTGTNVYNFNGDQFTLADAINTASADDADFENQVLNVTVPPAPPAPPRNFGPLLVMFYRTDATLTPPSDPNPSLTALLTRDSNQRRTIQNLVEAALTEYAAPPTTDVRQPAKNIANPQGNDWYIVRCVYTRPQCGLGALPVMSEPSRPFQLASFFDPDAPARSISVALPVDTTPAALRRYDKNVAFMISDQLGKQISRVKGLKQLMDGDLADPNGLGLGLICSFSIPIITICAFIALLIFLILLNLIFWWLPFFRICFPLPTFSAKGGGG